MIHIVDPTSGLPESRLYTFIDGPREFALYFLEGQKLIHDLVLRHDVRGGTLACFRDAVLSVQPMIALIKHGEQIGFYLDSERPYFRLKIEAGHHGGTRCALIPESLDEPPESMRGVVRVLKLFPRNRPPYQSVLSIDGLTLREVVNRVLRESYQVHSAVLVSEDSDQSIMLHQLPPLKGEYDYSYDALRERRDGLERALRERLAAALHEPEAIREAFAALGFRLIASRAVGFQCPCSRERVIRSIRLAVGEESESLFDPGQALLEITCEYCKSVYRIGRDDLGRAIGQQLN